MLPIPSRLIPGNCTLTYVGKKLSNVIIYTICRSSQHYNNKKFYDPSHAANSNRFNRSHQQMNSLPSHHNGAHDGRSQQYFMPATVLQSGPGYRTNWTTAMVAPQSSKDLIAEGGYLLDPLKIGQDNRTTIMVSHYY